MLICKEALLIKRRTTAGVPHLRTWSLGMVEKMIVERALGFLLLVYCSLVTVEGGVTQAQMEKMANGFRDSCVQKLGLERDRVAVVRAGNFPDDHDVACYTLCIMKKLRTFKNGAVDVDMVVKQVEMMMPAAVHAVAIAANRKCAPEGVHDDPCMAAYNFLKCNYNEGPENFFFP